MNRLLLLFLLPLNVFADGVYYGGGMGMGIIKADYTSAYARNWGSSYYPLYLMAGYQFDMDGFFVAPELELRYLSGVDLPEQTTSGDEKHMRGDFGMAYSAHLLLGYRYSSDVEIFGRLGAGKTNYEISSTVSSQKAEDQVLVPEFKESGSLSSTHFGLGVNFSIDEKITGVVQFRHIKNADFDFPVYGKTSVGFSSLNFGVKHDF